MMGLGGAIGTGLFMGSGIAIGYAGPAVMISYAIAAFIAVVMVLSLSEMAVTLIRANQYSNVPKFFTERVFRKMIAAAKPSDQTQTGTP
ncbi:MAG: hypothetical protein JSR98_07355, partial [Proteobacteria bacterium]|nr:hypothetical protein [Pseudomonadota bacterium]